MNDQQILTNELETIARLEKEYETATAARRRKIIAEIDAAYDRKNAAYWRMQGTPKGTLIQTPAPASLKGIMIVREDA